MPKRPNAGRKSLFTPELADQIIDKVSKGLSRAKACLYFDIHEDTLRNWCKEDPDFSARLIRAEIDLELKLLNDLQTARTGSDQKDWKASSWLLARKWPEQYSEKIKQEITSTIAVKTYANVSPDDWDNITKPNKDSE